MNPLLRLIRGLQSAVSDARVLGFVGFTFSLIASASVFYHYVEGWKLIDATYFSVMTISTVGYGDFVPQTILGKIFTMAYVLIGLGVFVTTASAVAEVLLSQHRGKPNEVDAALPLKRPRFDEHEDPLQ